MLKKLQAKWKVNIWNLLLIIATFAIGGSLCGLAGRKILLFTNLEKNIVWFLLYVVLISILWPFCVLIVSIPLGQFSFFKNYILKIRNRIIHNRNSKTVETVSGNIAILASGKGSNAKKIIEHFKKKTAVKIKLVVSNKADAGVLQVARDHDIEYLVLNQQLSLQDPDFLHELVKRKIDLIILAGFLKKIPVELIKAYPEKIINIHPALLPAYGGKGMYGMHVHEAVISANEKQSGITIHYVDEWYDHGQIIFQAACKIEPGETPETLANKIHALEHLHFPAVIETVLKSKKHVKSVSNNHSSAILA